MAISNLPLCYCTNVHPGNDLAEVRAALETHAVAVRDRRGSGILGTGLWLSHEPARQLADDADERRRLADWLAERRLQCWTLNTFPFGNFHGARVKEQVYKPGWHEAIRADYTLQCATVLAGLLPAGMEGSLSTVPLSFKPFHEVEPAPWSAFLDQLVRTARGLHELYRQTGKRIRLAIEPEPFCVLETTAETLAFFEKLFERADDTGLEPIAREYLGVCYDVCHQSVEFEDAHKSIRELRRNDVRINKVHITCAIDLPHPAANEAGRKRLATFVEPRYLHQTFAERPDGTILRAADLTADLATDPPDDWLNALAWRVHFHVPVCEADLGDGLRTTQPDLRSALAAVAALPYAPHLEVETYTWGVLPAHQRQALAPDLATGIANELRATQEMLGAAAAGR